AATPPPVVGATESSTKAARPIPSTPKLSRSAISATFPAKIKATFSPNTSNAEGAEERFATDHQHLSNSAPGQTEAATPARTDRRSERTLRPLPRGRGSER